MRIVIKKRKYRLTRRNQYTATIYHWNGNPLFRTTESYNNPHDVLQALVNLVDSKSLSIALPDGEVWYADATDVQGSTTTWLTQQLRANF